MMDNVVTVQQQHREPTADRGLEQSAPLANASIPDACVRDVDLHRQHETLTLLETANHIQVAQTTIMSEIKSPHAYRIRPLTPRTVTLDYPGRGPSIARACEDRKPQGGAPEGG